MKRRDSPQPAAGLLIRRAIAASVRRLLDNEPAAIAGRNAEAVHQARVAVRRLRSVLRTFHPLLDAAWSLPLRQELHWLGTELGAVRDLDVLIARLRSDAARAGGANDPNVAALLALVDVDRAAARKRLRAALRSERYRDLRSALAKAARAPRMTLAARLTASDGLLPIVRRCWKRAKRAVAGLPARPSARALHRIRIRAKRLRYAVETIAPLFGKQAAGFADAAAGVQDALGELNDAEAACLRLRRLRAAPETALAANALLALETEASARARDSWPAAWRELDDMRLRPWS